MLTIWSACDTTNSIINPFDSGETALGIPLTSTNQRLLATLSQTTTVNVDNGMLHFANQRAVQNYVNQVDVVLEEWELDDEYCDCESKECLDDDVFIAAYHAAEPASFAINGILGVKTLSTVYEEAEFYDHDYRDKLEVYIGDPELQMVLNERQEVRVDDKLYKYLPDMHMAIVSNADFAALDIVRNLGVQASGENIEIRNRSIPSSTSEKGDVCADVSIPCGLELCVNYETNIDGNFKNVSVEPKLQDGIQPNPPILVPCFLPDYTIDWGDSSPQENFTTPLSIPTETKNHTYRIDAEPGRCEEFTITVWGSFDTFCNDCVPQELALSFEVELCNPGVACTGGGTEHDYQKIFTYDGEEYKIRGEFGQTNTDNFLTNPKLWATSKFYRKKRGSFKKKCPPGNLTAGLRGYYYTRDCVEETGPVDVSSSKKKKKRTAKKVIDQSFGTRKTDDRVPIATFQADVGASDPEGTNDFPLWNF